MFAFVVVIHIITCILLITVILIQSGKGGGLTESFSGAESIFGTKTNAFMLRATSVLAIIFLFTCVGLALMSTQRSRSLIETELLKTKREVGTQTQLPGKANPGVLNQETVPAGKGEAGVSVRPVKLAEPVNAQIPASQETKPLEPTNQKNIVPGKDTTQTK